MKVRYLFILLLCCCFLSQTTFAQRKTKRRKLEARRTQLKKDIVYINALLSNTKRKEKNLLGEVKDLNQKIKRRSSIISTIKEEAGLLQEEILTNEDKIQHQQVILNELKQDYADIVYNSYKNKSKNKQLFFLLSSDNFVQAYKRFQYIKQYTHFRKHQADKIQEKQEQIKAMVDSLSQKKNKKENLLTEKEQEQKKILKEKGKQEQLLKKAKRKQSKYVRQLAKFQKEEAKIDRIIAKLIRDAIARSNTSKKSRKKRTRTKNFKGFRLTAEAKKLASSFTSNRGKLPWPVKKGYVSTRYGRQPHPIVKTATVQSNGVRITTSKGSKARSVFNGKILAVQVLMGNKKAILIQHGNYVTVYKNLEKVFVKKGQTVRTKQEIGTIFTDKITGKTIIGFLLTKNTKPQNPAKWIYRM